MKSRKIFPVTLLEHFSDRTHVQRSRRAPGNLIEQGSYTLDPGKVTIAIESGSTSSQSIQSTVEGLKKGIEYLQQYADVDCVQLLLDTFNNSESITLAWMENHDVLADVLDEDDSPCLRLDTGWIPALEESELDPTQQGKTVLAALIHLYLIAILAKNDQRDALHNLLDFIHHLPADDVDTLHGVLKGHVLDSNNAFHLFVELVNDSNLAWELEQFDLTALSGIRTSLLFAAGNQLEHDLFQLKRQSTDATFDISQCLKQLDNRADCLVKPNEIETLLERLSSLYDLSNPETPDAVIKLIEKTLKWRDKWVSWIMGQSRFDIPYDQTRVVRLMNEPMEDIDEKRALINEAISSTYDFNLEGKNIVRLSEWARDNNMRLVAGRLSRAFGNQAHLLSVAKVLADKQGLLPYVKKLYEASMALPDLQTQATRLLHLVQQRKPTPFAQTIGALNHFEEALFAYQSKEFKKMLQDKDDASRRIIGRPDAEACGTVLDSIQDRIRTLYRIAADLRDELERTQKDPAAYIIFLQRLHPAETINLANANFFYDVHPGKEDDLRDLTRQGGHYTYSSQGMGRKQLINSSETEDTHWIIHVDDWIEAIPLFIHERVVHRTVKVGNEEVNLEVIETEVDQEAMEAFFRMHAEFWTRNIDEVMNSEHVGLARRLLVRYDESLANQALAFRQANPDKSEDDAAYQLLHTQSELHDGIAAFGALINSAYRDCVEPINIYVEQHDVPRIEAVEHVILNDKENDSAKTINKLLKKKSASEICESSLKQIKSSGNGLAEQKEAMQYWVTRPTRPVPSLHILTTESAGMTEGYVQTWIEEEISLFNVIRNEGLEDEVKKRMDQSRTRVLTIGKKVIEEFGMNVVIEEVMAQQRLPEPAAVLTVMMSFRPVLDEAAKLAVLIEFDEKINGRKVNYDKADDPKEVDQYIKKHSDELTEIAVPKVAENNGKAFQKRLEEEQSKNKKASLYKLQLNVIESVQDYKEELDSLIRSEARRQVLEKLDRDHPELELNDQVRTFIRTHTQLAKSTARKEVLAEHKLNHLTMHPLNYYQATGGNKRYNLLYTPSRVNLGERERDSVVKWRQWVGGADRWAALAGFEFYSLINEGGVEERPALAYAEIQKTSENALCVTHFAGSNALALLCMAVLEGDAEDMADQMNLRHDRMIPPAGEGYGGYCVPKDGLFLAFVLSLQNEVKLRQIGIPERYHDGIMNLAKEALLHQHDFESHFEWQRWAATKLLKYSHLKKFFDFKENMLVFHITKIARAVENLGQPWHETTEGSKLVANLAAQWGVDKMIIRAEQVNRFMVFYKAWMIYDAIREAQQQHEACPSEDKAVVALSAEYKPVQDIRYSTGMRLFEILAHTGEHLTHSLDEEGQNLAHLMFNGFDPNTESSVGKRTVKHIYSTFYIDDSDKDTINRLREAFPPHSPLGDIIMTSVTMSSTQDMLHYTSDTKLEEISNQIQVILSDYGLTEDQIRANAIVYGGQIREWSGVKELPAHEQDELINAVRGKIHALVLNMRGPGRDYEKDIQGIDVLNTGIPFPELVDMLDNMPKVIALMRNGNPNSSLAITDGAAGRARRVLTYLDVQLFFAACEKIRRQGVYRAVGLGQHNIDRLREDMHRKRGRARRLYEAVAKAAQSLKEKDCLDAITMYRTLRDEITTADEAGKALREEEKMKRYKKWKKRDYYISQSLAKISAGLSLHNMDFETWLAGMGGMFEVIGSPELSIQSMRETWNQGVQQLAKHASEASTQEGTTFSPQEQADLYRHIVRPEYVPESQRFAQQMLVESSSKAVEIAAREALERRAALKVRAERARAFNDREDGFRDIFNTDRLPSFDDCWNQSQQCLKTIDENLEAIYEMNKDSEKRRSLQSNVNRTFGQVIGYTRQIITHLVNDIMPDNDPDQRSRKRQILDDLATLYTGREIIFEDLKRLAGGYEDIGGIARLAEAAQGDRDKLEQIAKAIELFYISFALAQTLEFALSLPDEVDIGLYWKNITDFFAETINDHWYEYWPWAYARGVGFSSFNRNEKFELTSQHHKWLYKYLRNLFVFRTELRLWDQKDRDALLGDFTGNNSIVGIGADAPTKLEQEWRAYNHLRELAFVKSDGFEFPPVFHEFDPDIIQADQRVNVVFLFPIGRTHVSRALREGPTLNAQIQSKKHPGTNFLISRHGNMANVKGSQKKVVLISDAHFYISKEEYAEALQQTKGLKKPEINKQIESAKESGLLTAKGIRIAARFAQKGKPAPVVTGALIPFHGQPVYTSGQTEEQGIPATIQSRIYTDVTYDKSLYPQIYTPETGVELPPEIDWLNEWNTDISPKDMLKHITEGYSKNDFIGLRAFAKEHPIILIKGAAESGARNLKVFEVQDEHTRIKENELKNAAQFVADVSRAQNVVIQAAVFTSPELWASPELMAGFVDRQIMDWNTPVNRDSYPRSQIYGTMRIVVSSSHPDKKYDTAFPISLMSLQVATNVGRGGTLEPLREEYIHERYRNQIMDGLRNEGPKVMHAMNEFINHYGPKWEEQTKTKIGEDLRGVSYGWANYLMCDYVILPVYKRNGRLVDILPEYDDEGHRIGSKPILQDEEGRFEGKIIDWKFIHLEPNVGIGLWDRYNLREEYAERQRSRKENKPFDWDNVGVSDRIVMRNFVLSGEDYLKANFGKDGINRKAINKAAKA